MSGRPSALDPCMLAECSLESPPGDCKERAIHKHKVLNKNLLSAILSGKIEEVRRSLQEGASVNATCMQTHRSALHLAVKFRKIEIVRLLLNYKDLEIRQRDDWGCEAVHLAAIAGNRQLLELLIKSDPDVIHSSVTRSRPQVASNTCYSCCFDLCRGFAHNQIPEVTIGATPLSLATHGEHKECVVLLLNRGAIINLDEQLHDNEETTSSDNRSTMSVAQKIIEILIDKACDVPKTTAHVRKRGILYKLNLTCMTNAVKDRNLPLIEFLLEHGRCHVTEEKQKLTILHRAVAKKHYGAIHVIHEEKNDHQMVNEQDSDGHTPLHLAVSQGWLEGVHALLWMGANVKVAARDGQTVLHLAAASSDSQILLALLEDEESKQIIETHNKAGETPLCLAVRAGQLACMVYLLKNGANINFMIGNSTLVHLAAREGHTNIIDRLIKHTHRFNLSSMSFYDKNNGVSALHIAALRGSKSCVQVLVNNGWDIYEKTDIVPHRSATPLHLAVKEGHIEVVKLMVELDKNTMNVTDGDECSPLHIAAKYSKQECLRFLLVNGADIGAVVKDSSGNQTALDFIVNYIPNPEIFLKETLDCCIEYNENLLGDPECEIKLKFDLFEPAIMNKKQLGVFESLLSCDNNDVVTNLLLHPVFETFLYLKWMKVRTFLYFMTSLYIVFAASLTTMTMGIYTMDLHSTSVNICVFISRFMLSISFILIILLELIKAGRMRHYYNDPEPWIKWTMILLSLLVLVGDHPADWLVNVSSVAVLLSWLELIFQVSRWPYSFLGLYSLMLFAVAKNVLKAMATFSLVIFGYVFAFMILFRGKGKFDTWSTSFVKVIVMTMELDYDVLEEVQGVNAVEFRIIILSFVVLVTIVMMNLVTGDAVTDISALKKEGKAKCLAKRVELFCVLENLLQSISSYSNCTKSLFEKIKRWRSVVQELKIEPGKPLLINQPHIPEGLKKSVITYVLERKNKSEDVADLKQTCQRILGRLEEISDNLHFGKEKQVGRRS